VSTCQTRSGVASISTWALSCFAMSASRGQQSKAG
jgi:hypothetical protein